MIKKKICCLLVGFMLAIGTVACGPIGENNQPVEIADADVTAKISVSILMDAGEKLMFTEAIKEFNKIYQNVTVELKQISSYESNIMNVINSGEQLDVLHVSDSYVSYFAGENVLENLEPYIAAKGFRQENGFDRSLYYDSMIRLGQLNFDGDQYMMPRDYSKIVTYWNKGMFDQYGIVKRPTMDWTWSDFLEVCEELSEKIPSNYIPLEASMEYAVLNYAILASNGVDSYLDDELQIRDDAEFKSNLLTGMNMAKNVVTEGYALAPEVFAPGDFFRKTAAMAFDVRPAFSKYANESQGIDFQVVPFPQIGTPETAKIPAGTSGFGIYKGSKNKSVAWAFINFIMSYEGQKTISEAGNVVPALKELAEDENAGWKTLKNGVGNEVDHEVFVKHPERDAVPDFFGATPALAMPMYKGAWSEFCSNYFNGKKDFDEAFTDLKKAVKDIKTYYPEYFE